MNKKTLKNKKFYWITLAATLLLGGGFVGAQKVVSVIIDEPVERKVKKELAPVKEDIQELQADFKDLQWDMTYIKVVLQKNMDKEEIEEAEAKTTVLMNRGRK